MNKICFRTCTLGKTMSLANLSFGFSKFHLLKQCIAHACDCDSM
uniref:Uncharacterized protein n=1 Tax=Arundo donax TaxID=35708 RepID=A0A0A8XUZ8_ARUDO